jgi:alpha-L-fucosidase
MRESLGSLFGDNLIGDRSIEWSVTGERTALAHVDLGKTELVGVIDLREDIARGQFIARYVVEGRTGGGWQALSRGTTIGYRKLDRITPISVRQVRVRIEDSVATPRPIELGLFAGS